MISILDKADQMKIDQSLLQNSETELKSRLKGQRLTSQESKAIYDQISDGVPIRDLKELYQISKSTIKQDNERG